MRDLRSTRHGVALPTPTGPDAVGRPRRVLAGRRPSRRGTGGRPYAALRRGDAWAAGPASCSQRLGGHRRHIRTGRHATGDREPRPNGRPLAARRRETYRRGASRSGCGGHRGGVHVGWQAPAHREPRRRRRREGRPYGPHRQPDSGGRRDSLGRHRPTGRRVAAGGTDHDVVLADLDCGHRKEVDVSPAVAQQVAFAPDGHTVAVALDASGGDDESTRRRRGCPLPRPGVREGREAAARPSCRRLGLGYSA